MKKRVILLCVTGCLLCVGCGADKETFKETYFSENAPESATIGTIDGGKTETKYQIPEAKGFLTVEETEQIEEEINRIGMLCGEAYRKAALDELGKTGMGELSEEALSIIADVIASDGKTAVTDNSNMRHPEIAENFWSEREAGMDTEACIFNIHKDGMISYTGFYVRNQKTLAYTAAVRWDREGNPVYEPLGVEEIDEMRLTEKGYLIYHPVTADYVGHASFRYAFRVAPLPEECREAQAKYLKYLDYTRCNMLLMNWDEDMLASLDYNTMFPALYQMKYKEGYTQDRNVPADLFEEVIQDFFCIPAAMLRAGADYNEETDTYPTRRVKGNPLNSCPEVVEVRENDDGSLTLTIDALCFDYDSDLGYTNTLQIQDNGDGSFKFLSNRIEKKELDIPDIPSNIY